MNDRLAVRSAPFTSPESRAAFNEVRDFILANLPPGALDRAAFELIDLRQDEVERAIAKMCDAVEAEILRAEHAPPPALAFSIPYVGGEMIKARLREIESQRGHA